MHLLYCVDSLEQSMHHWHWVDFLGTIHGSFALG